MDKKIIVACVGCGLVVLISSQSSPYCEKCVEERQKYQHTHQENYETRVFDPNYSVNTSGTSLSASPSPSPSIAPEEDL